MKHLRLLLALLAALVAGGSVNAQTWTGSPVAEGTYYLYNVGADKFLSYGSTWGTRAVIDDVGIPVTLESAGGNVYNIKTAVDGSGYLGADFYVDQAACNFTFTEIDGLTNVYALSYVPTDGTPRYRMWVTGATTFDQVQSIAAGGTWTLESLYWILVSAEERDAKFAAETPMDITYKYIENPNTAWFTGCYSTNNPWQGTTLGNFNGRDAGATYRDRNTEHYNKNYDTYIEATGVPGGKYRFLLSGYYRDGGGDAAIRNYKAGTSALNAKFYINDNTEDIQSIGVGMRTENAWGDANESKAEVDGTTYYVPNGQDVATYYFNEGDYPFQSVDAVVLDGTLRFGMKKETLITGDWTVFDRFRLQYLGPTISTKAVALPEDGAMAAGIWYYVDIATDGDYTLTATDLSAIIQTTDGTILFADEATVSGGFASEKMTLAKGRYYVKSTADNNLVIGVEAYAYVIGTPVFSIADGSTQATISTFTATFSEAASNDPTATFALLNTAAKAQLTKDGTLVAEGTLTLDGKALTATFPETTLENGAAYVLSIAAGVVGYEGQASNEAITVSIATPAVADGYYFLRDVQGRYVGRSSSYNTRANMEAFGLPMYVRTGTDGITTFTFIDSNYNLFDAAGGVVYTDNTTFPYWKVEATEGGYYIINKNNNGSYDKKLGTDGGTWLQSNESGLVWTFEPAAEHNTYMEALKDAQAKDAAAAAGLAADSKAALKAVLELGYVATPVEIDAVEWTEKYQVGAGSEWAGNGVKYYENTVSGLKPGLYKLTANAFYRMTWNGTVDAAAGARGNVYLYGNNVRTQLYSVFDFPADAAWVSGNDYQDANGKFYPNNPDGSKAALNAGNYENELFVYVTADDGEETGTLSYGIHQPSRFPNNGQWCSFQNFTLTRYDVATVAVTIKANRQHTAFSSDKPLNFEGTGLTAHIVTSEDGTSAVVTKVPANTGVIVGLDDKTTEAKEISVPVFTGETDDVTGNLLVAVVSSETIAQTADGKTNYVFGIKNGKEAFYKVAAAGITVPANNAYLPVSTAAAKDMIVLGGDTDGISLAEVADTLGGNAYNLQGQKVDRAQKGVYIVNGKKVILK